MKPGTLVWLALPAMILINLQGLLRFDAASLGMLFVIAVLWAGLYILTTALHGPLFRRELRNYFNTPIGYVFAVVCLLFNFGFFFLGIVPLVPAFWDAQTATIRGYMSLLPATFILFVPAVTMRIWAEERKSGTIELLSTLPLREVDLVLAKFAAAWTYVSALVLASLPLAFSVYMIGENFDWGATFTMYVGSILMAGAYVSLGMVISSTTREQIVAFILIFVVSALMFLANYYLIRQHIPPSAAGLIGFFTIGYHYDSFSRGVVDLSDLFFYISFMALMLTINVWILRRER
ncbi:MAG: ABC transporter permease [bacterium]|nr:ABC transporter permease [bacterium]